VQVIGVGSNLLVRDGGVPGVVIRLGRGFSQMENAGDCKVRSGTAVPDIRLAQFALNEGITLLTFLRGIPGTIGGALRMNAGAHGGETRDILIEARGIDRKGNLHVMSNADMGYSYRHSSAPDDMIFTSALVPGG
jgi:UDP-N-acetylmuramate dehydrogenase